MLLVGSDVKWNDSTSSAFGLALVHSLLVADAAKVLVLMLVAAAISPFKQSPKSKTGKRMRLVLKSISNMLQSIM